MASTRRVIYGRDLKSQKPLLFHGGREESGNGQQLATLVRAQHLVKMSMVYIQMEFHRFLTVNVKPNLALPWKMACRTTGRWTRTEEAAAAVAVEVGILTSTKFAKSI